MRIGIYTYITISIATDMAIMRKEVLELFIGTDPY